MTRTPPEPPDEELDELDEEAIVAQQSAAHAPQRRAQVKIETQSVVVADEDAEATRQLEVYTAGTADPTMVVRDRERRALARAMSDLPGQSGTRKRWVGLAIWGGAALLAFGLGAVLASMGGGSTTVTASSTPAHPPPAARPSAPARAVVTADTTVEAAAPSAPSASVAEPALDLDQLPVEPGAKPKVVRRPGHPTAPPTAKPRVKPPQVNAAPVKRAIPSGI